MFSSTEPTNPLRYTGAAASISSSSLASVPDVIRSALTRFPPGSVSSPKRSFSMLSFIWVRNSHEAFCHRTPVNSVGRTQRIPAAPAARTTVSHRISAGPLTLHHRPSHPAATTAGAQNGSLSLSTMAKHRGRNAAAVSKNSLFLRTSSQTAVLLRRLRTRAAVRASLQVYPVAASCP